MAEASGMPLGGVIFLTVFLAIFGTFLIYLARAIGGQRSDNSAVKKIFMSAVFLGKKNVKQRFP